MKNEKIYVEKVYNKETKEKEYVELFNKNELRCFIKMFCNKVEDETIATVIKNINKDNPLKLEDEDTNIVITEALDEDIIERNESATKDFVELNEIKNRY